MRKVLILCALLTGCATFSEPFDSTEYDEFVTVAWLANQTAAQCDNQNIVMVKALDGVARHAEMYSTLKGDKNKKIADASKILTSLTSEFLKSYQTGSPSEKYCSLKLDDISEAAKAIATTVAERNHD